MVGVYRQRRQCATAVSLFSFCLPFKIPFFLCFCPSTPYWKRSLVGVISVFLYLSFPFLMFASFFETHFLTSPFWNPSCFCFWHFFLLLFLFMFSWCMFLPFCFDIGLFLFCCFFDCVFVWFLVCFQTMIKHCFPCNSSVLFCHVGFKVVYFFQFHVFVVVCLSCVVCYQFKQLSCIMLFLCCPFL